MHVHKIYNILIYFISSLKCIFDLDIHSNLRKCEISCISLPPFLCSILLAGCPRLQKDTLAGVALLYCSPPLLGPSGFAVQVAPTMEGAGLLSTMPTGHSRHHRHMCMSFSWLYDQNCHNQKYIKVKCLAIGFQIYSINLADAIAFLNLLWIYIWLVVTFRMTSGSSVSWQC